MYHAAQPIASGLSLTCNHFEASEYDRSNLAVAVKSVNVVICRSLDLIQVSKVLPARNRRLDLDFEPHRASRLP